MNDSLEMHTLRYYTLHTYNVHAYYKNLDSHYNIRLQKEEL